MDFFTLNPVLKGNNTKTGLKLMILLPLPPSANPTSVHLHKGGLIPSEELMEVGKGEVRKAEEGDGKIAGVCI